MAPAAPRHAGRPHRGSAGDRDHGDGAASHGGGADRVSDGDGSGRRPARAGTTAPYVPFGWFAGWLAAMRRDTGGDPSRCAAWLAAAGAPASRLTAALRFLQLLDDAGCPTEQLRRLANAGEAARPAVLQLTIRRAYPALCALDLTTVTAAEFAAAFARSYGGSNSVRRKSRTFFLHAARAAHIPLNPGLARTIKQRSQGRTNKERWTSPLPGSPQPKSIQDAGRPVGTAGPGAADRSPSRHVPLGSSPSATAPAPKDRRRPAASAAAAASPELAGLLLSSVATRDMTGTEQRAFWRVLRYLKDHGL